MASRAILQVALGAFLLTGLARGADDPKLTGSDMPTAKAVATSDSIFVGQITDAHVDASASEPTSHGLEARYVMVTSRGSQLLRVSAKLRMVYRIEANIDDRHETFPQAGKSYIFFVHNDTAGSTVLKLVPATDDNIATVKKLISN